MAKSTLALELKSGNSIELRITGKNVAPQMQRFDFPNAEEAGAAMVRATEWALNFARTGRIAA